MVQPEKVKLITDMFAVPKIARAWNKFASMPRAANLSEHKLIVARREAFDKYCRLRDEFLGLPPLVKEVKK